MIEFVLVENPCRETFNVQADHPVLARPDKFHLSYKEAIDFAAELTDYGFDNIKITPDENKKA